MTRREILNRTEWLAEKAGLQSPIVYTCNDIYPKCYMTAIVRGERKQVSGAYMPSQLYAIYAEKNRVVK